ncbi:IS1 family transposase [Chroococcidiopsis sp. CCNUC1]|uniref:IS1 family transposase n=1 Tax=Chroococcidiopsis sp. CCNUC1 TaxID=2653189 RepID=UPI003531B31A
MACEYQHCHQGIKKKRQQLQQVNLSVLKQLNSEIVTVNICLVKLDEAESKRESELDEMWSFIGNKAKQRWLWHAARPRNWKSSSLRIWHS